MNKELEQKLYDEFPEIFTEKDWDMKETCLCWGLECPEGWYDLIREFCQKVYDHCKKTGEPIPHLVQLKEKFGGIRLYFNNAPEEIWNIANKYENKSYKICEVCGEPGKCRNKNGWLKTLCKKHAKKYGYPL